MACHADFPLSSRNLACASENTGFVHFNNRRIQTALIKQLNKLLVGDRSSRETVLAHDCSLTRPVFIRLSYETQIRLPSKRARADSS